MTAPSFGIINTRPEDEAVPVIGADFSKLGFVETSPDADPATFPLDEPVRFSSGDTAIVAKLGTGYLADAVKGVNAQLAELQVAADITVVRVAEGTATDAQTKLEQTTANIIGSAANQTGLYALKSAPEHVGATPRLIWAGRTAWQPDANSANPVVAALPEILNSLLGVAVVDAPESRTAALAWREATQSNRIIPVGVGARVYEGATVVTRPMAPRILGIGVRVDHEHEGKPFHPWANQAVNGIVGTSRNIAFSLTDGATEGQMLLESDIGIVVRGESGVDTAIADGGFVYIGTESTAEGDLWAQFHQVRGSDYLTAKMMRITRQYLGKLISADTVEAWINSIKFMLRDHKAANDILGYDVKFLPARNSVEEVRLGRLVVSPFIEPAPVFRRATHEVRRYAAAVDALVADIAARVNASGTV
ncbi:phage tail protein [Rhodomicrobium lacus]|uniref:phage tail protein n=1 Tax=Rhodomicrobium lacus TaxID=2498452 RepID=UPI000F8DCD48|nr:phage tail protein [Rhodomicrobium lacus]